MKKISQSTFTIAGNGFADGPSQALRDYLLKHKAKRVVTVSHPLVPEGSNGHIVTVYENGKSSVREIRLPHKPPYTYIFDPLVPLRLPSSTAWFGFNNLAAYRGLLRRKRGKTKKVYYWAVDFVPERFGKGLATRAYMHIDRVVSTRADMRVELSEAAMSGRREYLNITKSQAAPCIVAPMGAWLDRTPKVDTSAWSKKKIVYLGHLVERQGVATLIKALAILDKKHEGIKAEIVGSGPEIENLRNLAQKLGLNSKIIFHGFVKDHNDVESILATGTVAVAPYVKDKKSFTQYADPGKLKAYLGAGLPIVLTDVPPNATELQQAGVAKVVSDSPEAVAKGIEEFLSNQADWEKAHRLVLKYAQQFDWNHILSKTLSKLGFN